MTILDPLETVAPTLESSFEIEEGTLGPHLPRPSREMLTSGSGVILILIGFYLPWITMQIDNPDHASVQMLSGWTQAVGGFTHHPSDQLSAFSRLILFGLPVLAAVLAYAMQARWLRSRMTAFTCSLAVTALILGLFALLAESVTIFLYNFQLSFNSSFAINIGSGLILVWVGYLGLITGVGASCLGMLRGFQPGDKQI